MPIYEYVCKKCGHQQEALHKAEEKPRLACDECGAKPMSRQVSAAGFRLSGGGWYETDFKSNNKKNLAGDKVEKSDAPVKAGEGKPKAEATKTETAKAEPAKAEPATKPKAAKEKASKSAKK
jgi:putative FmdB family regulatory protein